METWSNQACMGYTILAAERLNLTTEQIQKIINKMYYEFDMKTVEEAAEYYRKSTY